MGDVSLATASDLVAGTLGLALLLVLVPPLWDNLGGLYVDLMSQDTIQKIKQNTELIPEISRARQVFRRITWTLILVLVVCYPSSAALYLLAQLVLNVPPYKILWQVIAAAAYAVPRIGKGVKPPDGSEPRRDREFLWRRYFTVRTVQVLAAAEVGILVWINDQGIVTAQKGAVVFSIWILALGGIRRALVDAYWVGPDREALKVHLRLLQEGKKSTLVLKSRATWIDLNMGIPPELWVPLTLVYVFAAFIVVARTLAPL